MKTKELPSYATVQEILSLSLDSGVLVWKSRIGSDRATKAWNTRYANKVAGYVNERGYVCIRINDKPYLAHRIVFMLSHGFDPVGLLVDHADGNTQNNAPSNLRVATSQENVRNQKCAASNSKTGVRGVTWRKSAKKYEVSLMVGKKRVYGGLFSDIKDAEIAAINLRKRIFGEFSGE